MSGTWNTRHTSFKNPQANDANKAHRCMCAVHHKGWKKSLQTSSYWPVRLHGL